MGTGLSGCEAVDGLVRHRNTDNAGCDANQDRSRSQYHYSYSEQLLALPLARMLAVKGLATSNHVSALQHGRQTHLSCKLRTGRRLRQATATRTTMATRTIVSAQAGEWSEAQVVQRARDFFESGGDGFFHPGDEKVRQWRLW